MSPAFLSLAAPLRILPVLTLLACGLGGTVQAATYTPGDLLLGFVAGGGKGADQSLVVNLGPASGFRDAFDSKTNKIAFANIGAQLVAQFGADWYDHVSGDPAVSDLYISVFGTPNASATLNTLYSGDPARTLYASVSRVGAGTPGQASSNAWLIEGSTAMTGAASQILLVGTSYAKVAADAQNVAIIPNSESNSLEEYTRPLMGDSFEFFTGGIEQIFSAGSFGTLGEAGAVEAALDLYRIQAKNNIAGQYGAGLPNGEGVYKGTITISQSGAISFIAKGEAPPAGGFNSWAMSKGLPDGTAVTDDRDNDGIPALTEYALDLNPTAPDTLPAPIPEAGSLRLTFPKGAAAAADPKISWQIEVSSTLGADWQPLSGVPVEATQISGLLPANDPSGRLFARLKVTQAD